MCSSDLGGMAAVALDSLRLKDVTEWSAAEVHEFLESIVPAHPCIDNFTYTSGYVLCSLDKEDLRRQTRDDEAANIIWAELRKCRRAKGTDGELKVSHARGGLEGPPTITVYVKVRNEVAFELDVHPSDTVLSLKQLVAERESTPPEIQRLISGGVIMQDDRTLSSYNVRNGANVLLVPHIREPTDHSRPMSFSAPRGVLMVPGSKAWAPATVHRPYVPVIGSGVARNFPVSIEFHSSEDTDTFAVAAQEEPPVLEIPPVGRMSKAAEAKVHMDPDTGGVRLDETENTLAPSTTYEAFLHFGGRGGQVKVSVVTGDAVA